MLLLSIDVGIRNLAYVVFNINEHTKETSIIEWSIVELCAKSENACKVDNTKIGINMNYEMTKLVDKFVFDKVVIENQIGKNAIRMKSIQSMIMMFFITKEYDSEQIINYNAANKLKFTGLKKSTYSERKKIGKDVSRQICSLHFCDWLEFYEACSKKDDLADCLLQIIDYSVKNNHISDGIYKQVIVN